MAYTNPYPVRQTNVNISLKKKYRIIHMKTHFVKKKNNLQSQFLV